MTDLGPSENSPATLTLLAAAYSKKFFPAINETVLVDTLGKLFRITTKLSQTLRKH